MTTSTAANVHATALKGKLRRLPGSGFKAMFNHGSFRDQVGGCRASTRSTGRGSWPRSSIISPPPCRSAAPTARSRSRLVPTGNFGDVFAGYCAKRMGLPIDRLVIATNENDILARNDEDRPLRDARRPPDHVAPRWTSRFRRTFERLLFDAYGRDASAVRRVMSSLKQSGAFDIDEAPLKAIRKEFSRRPGQRKPGQGGDPRDSGRNRLCVRSPYRRGGTCRKQV